MQNLAVSGLSTPHTAQIRTDAILGDGGHGAGRESGVAPHHAPPGQMDESDDLTGGTASRGYYAAV